MSLKIVDLDLTKMKILSLPNFDNDVFREITGIDVYHELEINIQDREKGGDVNIDGSY